MNCLGSAIPGTSLNIKSWPMVVRHNVLTECKALSFSDAIAAAIYIYIGKFIYIRI